MRLCLATNVHDIGQREILKNLSMARRKRCLKLRSSTFQCLAQVVVVNSVVRKEQERKEKGE